MQNAHSHANKHLSMSEAAHMLMCPYINTNTHFDILHDEMTEEGRGMSSTIDVLLRLGLVCDAE